jgi:hypothetical protein
MSPIACGDTPAARPNRQRRLAYFVPETRRSRAQAVGLQSQIGRAIVASEQRVEGWVTSIALIEEESDIFRHYDAVMAQRAQAVDVGFQDEFVEQPELEAAVRRFLAGEFVRQGHARLRDQGVDAGLLPDDGDLGRSLELDVFPDRDRGALEQKLRDFVAQTIRDPDGTGDGGGGNPPPRPAPPIKPIVSGSHQVGHICVQVSSGFPGPKLPRFQCGLFRRPARTSFYSP